MPKSVFSPQYRRFRELLIQARKAAELTQSELADRLKRPQSFVSKYENGERRLDLIEFLDVATVLNIDVVAFIHELQQEDS
jgi:transcriptional regulator with XRE-family HTH domain